MEKIYRPPAFRRRALFAWAKTARCDFRIVDGPWPAHIVES